MFEETQAAILHDDVETHQHVCLKLKEKFSYYYIHFPVDLNFFFKRKIMHLKVKAVCGMHCDWIYKKI